MLSDDFRRMRILEYASGRKLDKVSSKLLVDLSDADTVAEEANCLLEAKIEQFRRFHARLVERHEERVKNLWREIAHISADLTGATNERDLLREQVHVQSDRIVQLEAELKEARDAE